MDLAMLGMLGVGISLPMVLWDLIGRGSAASREKLQPYIQTAWLVLFIAGFGLLLKFMDFSAVLLAATVTTGLVCLGDWIVRRSASAESAPVLNVAPLSGATSAGSPARPGTPAAEPAWLELAKSFFPVILIVFLVRSFLVEPFKIPSGSMIPTLLVGDFILVNKFTWGIRLPVLNRKVVDITQPQRGEVMVFRYPEDTSTNFIKRIVGLPGDTVTYDNKRLVINGEVVPQSPDGSYNDSESSSGYQSFARYSETLGQRVHPIIVRTEQPPLMLSQVKDFPQRDACQYSASGFTCKVPAGHYFMMGDNRDSSSDSRYWGFVPEENIVGKAFIIWWNFSELSRVGTPIH